MTWFIKNKLKKLQRKIFKKQNQLIKIVNKYNQLLQELNNQNSFTPIYPTGQQPRERTSAEINEELIRQGEREMMEQEEILEELPPLAPAKTIPKKEDKRVTRWSEEQKKAFGEKMQRLRDEKARQRILETQPQSLNQIRPSQIKRDEEDVEI